MKNAFKDIFKALENGCSLLLQLSQMKKEMHKSMREFVAKFNRLIQRILATSRPNAKNQKTLFINVVPPDVSFHLIKDACAHLAAAQRLAIQLEDTFIDARKWKREVQMLRTASSSASIDLVL